MIALTPTENNAGQGVLLHSWREGVPVIASTWRCTQGSRVTAPQNPDRVLTCMPTSTFSSRVMEPNNSTCWKVRAIPSSTS